MSESFKGAVDVTAWQEQFEIFARAHEREHHPLGGNHVLRDEKKRDALPQELLDRQIAGIKLGDRRFQYESLGAANVALAEKVVDALKRSIEGKGIRELMGRRPEATKNEVRRIRKGIDDKVVRRGELNRPAEGSAILLIEPFEFEVTIPTAVARKNYLLKLSLGDAVRLKADDLLGLVELATKAQGKGHREGNFFTGYALKK
jgi:hypothetical protein